MVRHPDRWCGNPDGGAAGVDHRPHAQGGRIHHSRVQWGVVNGLVDGQKGYIREDGPAQKQLIKKTIY